MIKKVLIAALVVGLFGCAKEADVASRNLSTAADQFEIARRVVFYDSIQGKQVLVIEGLCSIKKDNADNQLEVTCKTSATEYKKHFLGVADNVTYIAEQLDPVKASGFRYRVMFRPETVIADFDLQVSK